MNLQFYGAAGQVTGSCMVLNTGRGRLMVDCGMFQGQHENDERNYSSLNFSPCDIDWVVLTHAHIDHSGLLPRFVKLGYRGPIYGTPATVDLTPLMLLDSVQIQKYDSDWRTKKNIRRGGPKIDPLYCKDDALATQKLLKPIPYGEWLELNRYVKIRLLEAGHILGSASLQVKVRTAETETVVVFSGDVGNRPVPILRDPAVIEKADVLVLESTYGNRLHDYAVDHRDLLKNILMEAVPKRGKVIIPSFAVGRVQEVLYEINYLVENKILQGMSTFVDSPLATEVSNVYMRHTEAYDKEAQDLVKSGDDPFEFPGLKYL
ncbi:MBL fold metallo-hydrolase, partial [bacterium]|nr:MBL fold metallo-hydrolase [bacterium]